MYGVAKVGQAEQPRDTLSPQITCPCSMFVYFLLFLYILKYDFDSNLS